MITSLNKAILIVLLSMVLYESHSQTYIKFTYRLDNVSLGNDLPIDWNVNDASSIGLSLLRQHKKVLLGGGLSFTKYNLFRNSDLKYEMEMTKYYVEVAKVFPISDKVEVYAGVYPYGRHFDTELLTASLKVDELNFGLGLRSDLTYKVRDKLKLGMGLLLERDLWRTAINRSEVTDYDRFVRMTIGSLTFSIIYTINLYSQHLTSENISFIP